MAAQPRWRLAASTTILASVLGLPSAVAGEWQRIAASEPFVDRTGAARAPGCSAGPVRADSGELVEANPDFAFFVRPGDPQKLVIIWDGGGTCFDGASCIGSALLGEPLYSLEVGETPERLARMGGIAAAADPANPVREYTQVFIPYCTGDVHIGNADTTYAFETAAGPVQWTIRHRGYDNVVAVLEWLSDHYDNVVGEAPRTVLLAGASAGGYGAQFAYPAVHERFPETTRMHLLTDSANGIVGDGFHALALGPNGVWAAWDNLSVELVNALAAGADDLPVALNEALGRSYPQTRFGQYTRAYDGVQVFYYNVTRHLDDPEQWWNASELFRAALTWTARARLSMRTSAAALPNYRMYLGEGLEHTIIGNGSFYSERSGDGILFRDWLADMLTDATGDAWRNASCEPDCLP
jgi:hypothetical protein